jgi:hypothetical protein
MVASYRTAFGIVWLIFASSCVSVAPALGVVRFAVIGDYGIDTPQAAQVAKMVLDWNPDFIVSVGDNNYGNNSLQHPDWDGLIGARYGSYILGRSDNRYPNQTSSTQRFFPVLGNHDVDSSDSRAAFLDYFDHDPGRPRGRFAADFQIIRDDLVYYDFDVENIRFFMLDSEYEQSYFNTRSTQEYTFDDRLESSSSDWNFAFFHHASYSSGYESYVPRMEWVGTSEPNLDVAFAGHDHIFEHVHRPEADYFVVGNSGQGLYSLRPVRLAESMAAFDQYFGALFVTVEPYKATFEFNSPGRSTLYRYQIQRLPEPNNYILLLSSLSYMGAAVRRQIA